MSSEKQIEELFKSGKWENFNTIRLCYLIKNSEEYTVPKVLISAPKKNYRRASERNRIKRQIREAYRLNKTVLVKLAEHQSYEILIALIYSGKPESDYWEIEKDIKEALQRVSKCCPARIRT